MNIIEVSNLIKAAKCPRADCDNKGTISEWSRQREEYEPAPCQWCHERDRLLKDLKPPTHETRYREALHVLKDAGGDNYSPETLQYAREFVRMYEVINQDNEKDFEQIMKELKWSLPGSGAL